MCRAKEEGGKRCDGSHTRAATSEEAVGKATRLLGEAASSGSYLPNHARVLAEHVVATNGEFVPEAGSRSPDLGSNPLKKLVRDAPTRPLVFKKKVESNLSGSEQVILAARLHQLASAKGLSPEEELVEKGNLLRELILQPPTLTDLSWEEIVQRSPEAPKGRKKGVSDEEVLGGRRTSKEARQLVATSEEKPTELGGADKNVGIRLSSSQLEEVDEAAEFVGLKRSTYVRYQLLGIDFRVSDRWSGWENHKSRMARLRGTEAGDDAQKFLESRLTPDAL